MGNCLSQRHSPPRTATLVRRSSSSRPSQTRTFRQRLERLRNERKKRDQNWRGFMHRLRSLNARLRRLTTRVGVIDPTSSSHVAAVQSVPKISDEETDSTESTDSRNKPGTSPEPPSDTQESDCKEEVFRTKSSTHIFNLNTTVSSLIAMFDDDDDSDEDIYKESEISFENGNRTLEPSQVEQEPNIEEQVNEETEETKEESKSTKMSEIDTNDEEISLASTVSSLIVMFESDEDEDVTVVEQNESCHERESERDQKNQSSTHFDLPIPHKLRPLPREIKKAVQKLDVNPIDSTCKKPKLEPISKKGLLKSSDERKAEKRPRENSKIKHCSDQEFIAVIHGISTAIDSDQKLTPTCTEQIDDGAQLSDVDEDYSDMLCPKRRRERDANIMTYNGSDLNKSESIVVPKEFDNKEINKSRQSRDPLKDIPIIKDDQKCALYIQSGIRPNIKTTYRDANHNDRSEEKRDPFNQKQLCNELEEINKRSRTNVKTVHGHGNEQENTRIDPNIMDEIPSTSKDGLINTTRSAAIENGNETHIRDNIFTTSNESLKKTIDPKNIRDIEKRNMYVHHNEHSTKEYINKDINSCELLKTTRSNIDSDIKISGTNIKEKEDKTFEDMGINEMKGKHSSKYKKDDTIKTRPSLDGGIRDNIREYDCEPSTSSGRKHNAKSSTKYEHVMIEENHYKMDMNSPVSQREDTKNDENVNEPLNYRLKSNLRIAIDETVSNSRLHSSDHNGELNDARDSPLSKNCVYKATNRYNLVNVVDTAKTNERSPQNTDNISNETMTNWPTADKSVMNRNANRCMYNAKWNIDKTEKQETSITTDENKIWETSSNEMVNTSTDHADIEKNIVNEITGYKTSTIFENNYGNSIDRERDQTRKNTQQNNTKGIKTDNKIGREHDMRKQEFYHEREQDANYVWGRCIDKERKQNIDDVLEQCIDNEKERHVIYKDELDNDDTKQMVRNEGEHNNDINRNIFNEIAQNVDHSCDENVDTCRGQYIENSRKDNYNSNIGLTVDQGSNQSIGHEKEQNVEREEVVEQEREENIDQGREQTFDPRREDNVEHGTDENNDNSDGPYIDQDRDRQNNVQRNNQIIDNDRSTNIDIDRNENIDTNGENIVHGVEPGPQASEYDDMVEESVENMLELIEESIKEGVKHVKIEIYIRSPDGKKPRKIYIKVPYRKLKDAEKRLKQSLSVNKPQLRHEALHMRKNYKSHVGRRPRLIERNDMKNRRWTQKEGAAKSVIVIGATSKYIKPSKPEPTVRVRMGRKRLEELKIVVQCKPIERIKVDEHEFPGILPERSRRKFRKKKEELMKKMN